MPGGAGAPRPRDNLMEQVTGIMVLWLTGGLILRTFSKSTVNNQIILRHATKTIKEKKGTTYDEEKKTKI